MNMAVLSGRLTKDPEMRYGQNDNAITRYSLAINKGRGQDAQYINIVSFGKAAEFADKYFKKGMRVLVSGYIQTGSYINKDGDRVNTFNVVAESQEFADSKGAKDGE